MIQKNKAFLLLYLARPSKSKISKNKIFLLRLFQELDVTNSFKSEEKCNCALRDNKTFQIFIKLTSDLAKIKFLFQCKQDQMIRCNRDKIIIKNNICNWTGGRYISGAVYPRNLREDNFSHRHSQADSEAPLSSPGGILQTHIRDRFQARCNNPTPSPLERTNLFP